MRKNKEERMPTFKKYEFRVQETLYMDVDEKKLGRKLAIKEKKKISDFYMDIIRPVVKLKMEGE